MNVCKIIKQCLFLLLNFNLVIFGGEWTQIDIPDDEDIFDIFAVNKNVIYVVGDDGMIIKTINGGREWEELDIETGERINSVFFINEKIGWVVGGTPDTVVNVPGGGPNGHTGGTRSKDAEGFIYSTVDGGASWTLQFEDEVFINDVYFSDINNGVATGDQEALLFTTNGGMSWSKQELDFPNVFQDLCVIDKKTFILLGRDGNCVATTDAGFSWLTLDVRASDNQDFKEDELTAKRVFRKINGNWQPINNGRYAIDFLNSSEAHMVGDEGLYSRSFNGGNTWNIYNLESGDDLSDVDFINSGTGWIVGEDGLTFKTTDGGDRWKKYETGTTEDLNVCHFFKDGSGYTGGEDGTLLYYSPDSEESDSLLAWHFRENEKNNSQSNLKNKSKVIVAGKEDIANKSDVAVYLLERKKQLKNINKVSEVTKRSDIVQGIIIFLEEVNADIVVNDILYKNKKNLYLQCPRDEYNVHIYPKNRIPEHYNITIKEGQIETIKADETRFRIQLATALAIGSVYANNGAGAAINVGTRFPKNYVGLTIDAMYSIKNEKKSIQPDTLQRRDMMLLGMGICYGYTGFNIKEIITFVPKLSVGRWFYRDNISYDYVNEYGASNNLNDLNETNTLKLYVKPGFETQIGRGKIMGFIGGQGFIGDVAGFFNIYFGIVRTFGY